MSGSDHLTSIELPPYCRSTGEEGGRVEVTFDAKYAEHMSETLFRVAIALAKKAARG